MQVDSDAALLFKNAHMQPCSLSAITMHALPAQRIIDDHSIHFGFPFRMLYMTES